MPDIAQSLDEVSHNFSPKSIHSEDDFYTNIDSIRSSGIPKYIEIKNAISREQHSKVLFAGHTGSGKSTELNRLASEIEDSFEVIKFSVKETNDPLFVQYEDLLIASISKVLEHVKEKDIHIEDNTLTDFNVWINNAEITKEIMESVQTEASSESGAEVKFPILVSFFTKLSLKLKVGSHEKVTYRESIEKNITQLILISKKLFTEIEKQTDKKILLIIEDLDKLDTKNSKQIFIDNSTIFSEIPLTIIYTVPIFLMHTSEMSSLDGNVFHTVTLPMIKTRTQESHDAYTPGIEKIKELIAKRMDLKLFDNDETIDYVIYKTGGVLRDLFQVIVKASESALYKELITISKDDINYYLNERKNFYYRAISGSTQRNIKPTEIIEKLLQMNKENITKPSVVDETTLEALRLQVLIEYNGITWYGIHPLVIEHLETLNNE